jgi:hypothetical protein
MTLHIITGSSAAARLDAALEASDDILLLENARAWNLYECTNLDPVEHTAKLQRAVLTGRPRANREFHIPQNLREIDGIRRGDPVCIWSARNLDDAMLFLWLFNYLDKLGYASDLISFAGVFVTAAGDPVSSVEQLSNSQLESFSRATRRINADECAFLRDRWHSLAAREPAEFGRVFAFDYSVLKGWQDIFLSVIQRVPVDYWGQPQEVVVLLECLRLADWDEQRAFVTYVTHVPFSASKLRAPDATALLARLRTEAERLTFTVQDVDVMRQILQSASSDIGHFCVPFFWEDSLTRALPVGIGARILR